MRYGIPYQGSKNSIAREIVRFLPAAGTLIDICAGGCAITHAALELCDVACGRAEAYFEALLSPWDYAAGSLIVQEAGGFATDIAGKPLQFAERSSLAAANPACFDELLRLAREAKLC